MNEDIISAKDFQIKNLQNQLVEKNKEIESLNKMLDNAVYFTILAGDTLEKSRRMILAALRGEAEKPILKLEDGQ